MTRKTLAVFLCALLVMALLPCAASAMTLQHNITALNAHRNLTNKNIALTNNLEKLSSGYRINRAGDDAAGLAISEQMRSQIQGLHAAQAGSQNTFILTTEDALTAAQRHYQSLVDAELLSYDITPGSLPEDYDAIGNMDLFMGQVDNSTLFYGASHAGGTSGVMMERTENGYALLMQVSTDGTLINVSSDPGVAIVASNGIVVSVGDGVADLAVLDSSGTQLLGTRVEVEGDVMHTIDHSFSTGEVKLPVGDTAQVNVSVSKTPVDAVSSAREALNAASAQSAHLGALQNRLEHTINNLAVQSENIQASESRIRDVDMAREMTEFTKNNILIQASQAMLAQANTVPQGMLQLLQ